MFDPAGNVKKTVEYGPGRARQCEGGRPRAKPQKKSCAARDEGKPHVADEMNVKGTRHGHARDGCIPGAGRKEHPRAVHDMGKSQNQEQTSGNHDFPPFHP